MNKWKEFASMFGLELDENFMISYDDKIVENFYRITDNGIQWKSAKGSNGWCLASTYNIDDLLTGDAEVIKMPFKPKERQTYWVYFAKFDCAVYKAWYGDYTDYASWKIGNCFKTEEEALTKGKEIIQRIKVEFDDEY